MTDDEHAAALCSIALTALLSLSEGSCTQVRLQSVVTWLVNEIARLRNCTPEDIQNEFEGKGR